MMYVLYNTDDDILLFVPSVMNFNHVGPKRLNSASCSPHEKLPSSNALLRERAFGFYFL